MRRRLLSAVFALALGLAGAAPAVAAPVGTVNLIACAFGGGSVVAAGTPITVTVGLSTSTLGQAGSFLKAASVAAAVDGTPIQNAKAYFSQPIWDTASRTAIITWTYPTGRTLAVGFSLTVTIDVVVSRTVTIGKELDSRRQELIQPGSIFGGPITCTVTAS